MSTPQERLEIGEYRPGVAAVLSDAQRWPTLDAAGAARLRALRVHPDAPVWTHATGDRLDADAIGRVLEPRPHTGWLTEHLQTARGLLAYRGLGRLERLEDFPTISREDLIRDIGAYVPLNADLRRLVHGTSSGSTGHALLIPDDLEDTARTFHLFRSLAAADGVVWDPDPRRLALVNVVHQQQAFSYAGSISSFGHAGMARLNLHASAWARGEGQRNSFLRAQDPQVITGDPSSLTSLLGVGGLHPLALFSSAMGLTPGARAALQDEFGVPVYDVYGLHETRPIAVRSDDGPHRILDRRVHVEILDAAGVSVPSGTRGEVVVTAGENPLLPLVRYRTGDFGRLVTLSDGTRAIADLEGREEVVFATVTGARLPAVDVTQQLQRHGAIGWTVHQGADGSVAAAVVGGDSAAIEAALAALFGAAVPIRRVATLADLGEGKPRRYRRDVS
ncbi:CoF synthetase [Mycobacterium sp. GA-1841]|uniref:CoF synthetase n=1 Tax=Mycobacterium sp. GA-1841 TaxID=1834154 RepID=UPI00096F508A|nr:CoF synthetase [Mycobacterium sp. GA-1841]OMC40277.1 CoF synthetase [Mycobacterium sp. GA-1841]